MKLKILISIVLVGGIIAALALIKKNQFEAMGAAMPPPPPETVSSAVAKHENWQETLKAVGSITAAQGVIVAPEVAGLVREIAFESGATVAKGDLLVRLDTSSEEAQLRAIESQVNLARINAERARQLRADNTVSQSELDTADAALKQAEANADTVRATIEKKTIRAPFPGRLGIRQVNVGEYLDTGHAIVSLQAISKVYADFSLPQQELARLKTGMRVRLSTDTYPDKTFEGELTAINPNLSTTTRSVRLQATLDNPDHLLRPGMFARIEVLLPTRQEVLVVPATSILSAPYGDSVYVIEPATNSADALIVRQQFVRTGRARGDFVAVEAGLKPGEQVVSAGIFKLRNGMHVTVNNELSPKPSETPRPSDG